MDIRKATLHALAEDLKNGRFSSEELCREYLKQIDARDAEIGAFLEIDRENMLNAAKASDDRRAAGRSLSDFDGIPVAIKDNIAVANERCSCASKLLEPVIVSVREKVSSEENHKPAGSMTLIAS